jgi:predicted ATPase
VTQLLEQTNGNPFFLERLAPFIHGDVSRPTQSWARVLPRPLRDAVARQLAGVSRGACRLLLAAAVLGTEFSLSVLSRIVGASPAVLTLLVDEAGRAGIVARDRDRDDVYRFAHSLLRDALYERVPADRRAEWQARVVGAEDGPAVKPARPRSAYSFFTRPSRRRQKSEKKRSVLTGSCTIPPPAKPV